MPVSPPRPQSALPMVSHGEGVYVYDKTGKRYIDGSAGPALFCIGHANAEVNAAIADQLARIAHGYRDRKSTRLNSSHIPLPRKPSSA